MISVLARISIKPEFASEAAKILTDLVVESRKESGNRSYFLFQQNENRGEFHTVEEWDDDAAMDAHMKSAHIAAAIGAAGPMFAAPPDIQKYTKLI